MSLLLGMLRLNGRSRLTELTDNLTDLRKRVDYLSKKVPELSAWVGQTGTLWTYNVEAGEFKSRSLRYEKAIAIAESFATAGTRLGEHCHSGCKEWICVLEGEMILYIEDEEHHLQALDTLEFDGSRPHRAFFPRASRLIAIAIPSAPGFPEEAG